jgi:hypothetical protein
MPLMRLRCGLPWAARSRHRIDRSKGVSLFCGALGGWPPVSRVTGSTAARVDATPGGRRPVAGQRCWPRRRRRDTGAVRPRRDLPHRPHDADNRRPSGPAWGLPLEGWGELLLTGSRAEVSGTYYAPRGARHHERPLKRRSPEDIRSVPIPPALVEILRAHLNEYGTARDGRLFFGAEKGENVPGSVYTRIWAQAREIGLSPTQSASPLARRPYDLRHAALSTWLAAGVPPTEVAARGGNSVKVLLTVYAKCLDGQRATYNDRIATLLEG